MLDLLHPLLDTGIFIPHGHCYLWKPSLVWLHIVSDSLTALAYYSIPAFLIDFAQKRQDLPFRWLFWLFGAFIVCCGTTHLLEVLTLWHPIYWVSGGIKAITALISLTTAVAVFALRPQALALPSPAQLEAANSSLEAEMVERRQAETALRRYERMVSTTTDGMALIDRHYTYQVVNQAYQNWRNQTRDEIVGHTVKDILGQDLFEQVVQPQLDLSLSGQIIYDEMWIERPDQEPQFLSVIYVPYLEPDQSISGVVVSVRDITKLKQAEKQIQKSLKEKEVLLKEIHHRVKNNLQIVYSLLRLQRHKLKDQQAATALLESQNRIETIALIHEKLYCSKDLARIDCSEYIAGLVANLFSTYNINPNQVALETQIDSISLDIDKAIPCGLMINELVSNALKYAFPTSAPGKITVELRREDSENVLLVVRDNGVGMLDTFDLARSKTLGLKLVQNFVIQLKGTLEMACFNGTEFRIAFPGSCL